MKMILIRGLPGSGKSTLAKMLVGPVTDHYEADMYFVKDGVYKFDSSAIGDAHQWCQESVRRSLQRHRSVVVSNTFTQAWELEDYFIIAKFFGITPNIVKCQSNFGSIHSIPQEAYDRMASRWQEEVPSFDMY